VVAVLEFEETELELLELAGMTIPVLRLTSFSLPYSQITQLKVGSREYHYDSSYPIKGYAAILPRYLAEHAGKQPLLVERPTRFYLYFAV
jgi:hypothetical protein